MSDEYRPPLADYFDALEKKYGADMIFEKAQDEELMELQRLAKHAIQEDAQITQVEKANLKPLLTLIELQRSKRSKKNTTH